MPKAEKWWLLTLALLSYRLAFNSLICIVVPQIGRASDLTCFSLVQSRTLPDDAKYPAKLHQSGSARWAAVTSRPYMSVALAQWQSPSGSEEPLLHPVTDWGPRLCPPSDTSVSTLTSRVAREGGEGRGGLVTVSPGMAAATPVWWYQTAHSPDPR